MSIKKNGKIIYKYFKDKYDKPWLKKIDETKNYFLEEIKGNGLMSEKHKKVCRTLNYFDHILAFVTAISGYVSVSVLASLLGVPVGIASSAINMKICIITAGIKKYKSAIKKNTKRRNKTVLLAKVKFKTIKVLISKALINSYINHEELVSVNNVLRQYSYMKDGNKNTENVVEHTI